MAILELIVRGSLLIGVVYGFLTTIRDIKEW